MTEEQIKTKAKEQFPNDEFKQQAVIDAINWATKELEKENAELKEKINILDNCDRLGDVITEAYKDQLTKAKEIIKDFLLMAKVEHLKDKYETVDEAEQFLKESE